MQIYTKLKHFKVLLWSKIHLLFSLKFSKVCLLSNHHSKIYAQIPKGTTIILAVIFGFPLPPLLDSKMSVKSWVELVREHRDVMLSSHFYQTWPLDLAEGRSRINVTKLLSLCWSGCRARFQDKALYTHTRRYQLLSCFPNGEGNSLKNRNFDAQIVCW